MLEQMDEVAQLRKEMDDRVVKINSLKSFGQTLQSKCHPLAEQPLKYWMKILQNRWEEVSNAVDSRRDFLEKVSFHPYFAVTPLWLLYFTMLMQKQPLYSASIL